MHFHKVIEEKEIKIKGTLKKIVKRYMTKLLKIYIYKRIRGIHCTADFI